MKTKFIKQDKKIGILKEKRGLVANNQIVSELEAEFEYFVLDLMRSFHIDKNGVLFQEEQELCQLTLEEKLLLIKTIQPKSQSSYLAFLLSMIAILVVSYSLFYFFGDSYQQPTKQELTKQEMPFLPSDAEKAFMQDMKVILKEDNPISVETKPEEMDAYLKEMQNVIQSASEAQ